VAAAKAASSIAALMTLDRLKHSTKLLNYLFDHDFWSDRALMRQVEAEVDGGFSHFCF